MRFLLALFLTILLSYYLGKVLPWWIIAPLAGLTCGALKLGSLQSALVGFVGVGSLWLALAWRVYLQESSQLPEKMSVLFGFEDPLYLAISTGVLGGLVGGLGACTGSMIRRAIRHPSLHRRGPYF